MNRVEMFSTAGYARADSRLAYWNDLAASTIGPLVIEARDRDSFDATMKRVRLRNCEILAPTSNAASVRTRPMDGAPRDYRAGARAAVMAP